MIRMQPKNRKIRIAPKKEYDRLRKYFAFSCADLVIFDGKSVLLTKRTRHPYKGYWHLPGSIIHKNEKITDTVKRSAKEELNLDVDVIKFLGFYESLDKYRHDISHGFVVSATGKMKTDYQSSDLRFFEHLPRRLVPHHRKMIIDARSTKFD
jgi:ADP-ribose pyrophosphatase YjhB (NUDIX family)